MSADSESGEPQSPAPKKTRRGKRGGKNQKLRAESLKRVTVDELGRLGRTSLDLSTVSLLPNKADLLYLLAASYSAISLHALGQYECCSQSLFTNLRVPFRISLLQSSQHIRVIVIAV